MNLNVGRWVSTAEELPDNGRQVLLLMHHSYQNGEYQWYNVKLGSRYIEYNDDPEDPGVLTDLWYIDDIYDADGLTLPRDEFAYWTDILPYPELPEVSRES